MQSIFLWTSPSHIPNVWARSPRGFRQAARDRWRCCCRAPELWLELRRALRKSGTDPWIYSTGNEMAWWTCDGVHDHRTFGAAAAVVLRIKKLLSYWLRNVGTVYRSCSFDCHCCLPVRVAGVNTSARFLVNCAAGVSKRLQPTIFNKFTLFCFSLHK